MGTDRDGDTAETNNTHMKAEGRSGAGPGADAEIHVCMWVQILIHVIR